MAFAPLPVWAFLACVAKTFVNAPAPKNTSVMRVRNLSRFLSCDKVLLNTLLVREFNFWSVFWCRKLSLQSGVAKSAR